MAGTETARTGARPEEGALVPRTAAATAAGAVAAVLASDMLSPTARWWSSSAPVPFVHATLAARIEYGLAVGVFGVVVGWLATGPARASARSSRFTALALPLCLALGPTLALIAALLAAPTAAERAAGQALAAAHAWRLGLVHAAIVVSAGSVAALTAMFTASAASLGGARGKALASGIAALLLTLAALAAPAPQGAAFPLVACVPLSIALALALREDRGLALPLAGAVAAGWLGWSGLDEARAWEAERLRRAALPRCTDAPPAAEAGARASASPELAAELRCRTSEAFFPDEQRRRLPVASRPVPLSFRYAVLDDGIERRAAASALARALEASLAGGAGRAPGGAQLERPADPPGLLLFEVCRTGEDGAPRCAAPEAAAAALLPAPGTQPTLGAVVLEAPQETVDLVRAERLLELRLDRADLQAEPPALEGWLNDHELLAAVRATLPPTAARRAQTAARAQEADRLARALLAPLGTAPVEPRRLAQWLVRKTHTEREGAWLVSTGLAHLAAARTSSGAAAAGALALGEAWLAHARWITRKAVAAKCIAGLAELALAQRPPNPRAASELYDEALTRAGGARPPLVLLGQAAQARASGAHERALSLAREARTRARAPETTALVGALVEARATAILGP